MEPVTEEVIPGLWSIPVPIPDNPLGHTLVYLFDTDRGFVLVDAGWDADVSWDALVAGCVTVGTSIAGCYGVLVTHAHPDHHGLSGRVREASGAWIALHERDAALVTRISRAAGADRAAAHAARADQVEADFRDEFAAVLLDAGASEADLAGRVTAPKRRNHRPRPLATPDRWLADGDRMDVPGWVVDAVWTPGHSPGHTCFRVPEHRLLLAGDHVLPTITPHISISRADRHGDPLGDYLESLQKVDQPDVSAVLPAHQHRFADLHGRVVEISSHHDEHLLAIEQMLTAAPRTLWEIAGELKWNRPWSELSLSMKRAAVNETAAHLRYLSRRDRVVRHRGVRPLTFGLPASA